jgi:hypothetical protein
MSQRPFSTPFRAISGSVRFRATFSTGNSGLYGSASSAPTLIAATQSHAQLETRVPKHISVLGFTLHREAEPSETLNDRALQLVIVNRIKLAGVQSHGAKPC